MSTDQDEMPSAFAELAEWLASSTRKREESRSQSFGDRLVAFVMDGPHVRLVRDRGQWRIDISPGEPRSWYDVGVWNGYLNGPDASTVLPSPEEQARFVRGNLAAIRQAILTDRSITKRLGAIGWTRNRATLGLPPPPPPAD